MINSLPQVEYYGRLYAECSVFMLNSVKFSVLAAYPDEGMHIVIPTSEAKRTRVCVWLNTLGNVTYDYGWFKRAKAKGVCLLHICKHPDGNDLLVIVDPAVGMIVLGADEFFDLL